MDDRRLGRIRWGNVGRLAALAGVVVLVVAWPTLSADPPHIPEAGARPLPVSPALPSTQPTRATRQGTARQGAIPSPDMAPDFGPEAAVRLRKQARRSRSRSRRRRPRHRHAVHPLPAPSRPTRPSSPAPTLPSPSGPVPARTPSTEFFSG